MVVDGKKACPICGDTKPVDMFYRCPSRVGGARDGYSYGCKPCTKRTGAEKRAKGSHPPAIESVCTACRETKSASEFSLTPSKRNGLASRCRACNVKAATESAKRNPEKVREHKRGWKKRNPDRVAAQHRKDAKLLYQRNRVEIRAKVNAYRAANVEKIRAWWTSPHGRMVRRLNTQRRNARVKALPATLTEAQWATMVAAYDGLCAYCPKPWEEIDHVVPVSRGGGLVADNVLPACGACNVSKHNRAFEEFCRSRGLDPVAIRARARASSGGRLDRRA